MLLLALPLSTLYLLAQLLATLPSHALLTPELVISDGVVSGSELGTFFWDFFSPVSGVVSGSELGTFFWELFPSKWEGTW